MIVFMGVPCASLFASSLIHNEETGLKRPSKS